MECRKKNKQINKRRNELTGMNKWRIKYIIYKMVSTFPLTPRNIAQTFTFILSKTNGNLQPYDKDIFQNYEIEKK